MTPPLDLFRENPRRVLPHDAGQQAYYADESIDSHGLTDAREIADWQAGWAKAEQSERTAVYRAQVQSDAVLLAKGLS